MKEADTSASLDSLSSRLTKELLGWAWSGELHSGREFSVRELGLVNLLGEYLLWPNRLWTDWRDDFAARD